MANLVQTIKTFDRDTVKISGPLGKIMTLKSGENSIKAGQVLAYDDSDGKLVKYNHGSNIAMTIALEDADSTSGDVPVLVAVPGTIINEKAVKGPTLSSDHKTVKELWGNGIILEKYEKEED